jgi:hypothetical protein
MSTSSFMNQYFGPLSREYCVYFYALSIIFGVIFATSVISIAYFMITHIKKVNLMFIVNSVLILLNSFLAYLANRLLHTMCVKSI